MVAKKAWSSILYGRTTYDKRVKRLRRKLSTVNPVSKNVTGLTMSLNWPCGVVLSCKKRTVKRRIPRKLTLHGIFVHGEGSTKLKTYDIPRRMQHNMVEYWPSFDFLKPDNDFWCHEWCKHGAKTGLSPFYYWKMGLCLRKLFLTGLNLMINIPMKAEDLVESLRDHMQANLDLRVTPQILCVLSKNLEIPCLSEEFKQMTTRRRVYMLTEVRLCVDVATLDFVDDTADDFSPYLGCRAKSLVVIPFVKSKP